jgi:hypothetical protein
MEYNETNYKALYGSAGSQYPDNTSGLITELIMRTFGQNTADSLLFRQNNSVWRDCGSVDLSSNAWPTTGGTGVGGAILKNNTFDVTVQGTPAGMSEPILVGMTIRAKTDTPGQTNSNWQVLTGMI